MLAQACCVGVVRGRVPISRTFMPVAMAPDDTRTTRTPDVQTAATSSTSFCTRPLLFETRILLPILMTTVFGGCRSGLKREFALEDMG